MNRMTKKSTIRNLQIILGGGLLCYITGDIMDLETRTILYSWVILIIGCIIYNLWFNITKDYINNEEAISAIILI